MKQHKFEARVERIPFSGCWIWMGADDGIHGYGRIAQGKNRSVGAHIFSYRLFKGVVPSGMLVCHTCDVRLCVNPDHMFLGTCADNLKDMRAKGRGRATSPRLTEPQRIEIKRLKLAGGDAAKIASSFGIEKEYVYRLSRRNT